jgi:hypothetical protein
MSSVHDDVLVLFFAWPGRAHSPSDSSDSIDVIFLMPVFVLPSIRIERLRHLDVSYNYRAAQTQTRPMVSPRAIPWWQER